MVSVTLDIRTEGRKIEKKYRKKSNQPSNTSEEVKNEE